MGRKRSKNAEPMRFYGLFWHDVQYAKHSPAPFVKQPLRRQVIAVTKTLKTSATGGDLARLQPVRPEYIRLPKAGSLCPWTGLSRSKLNELILPSPLNGFQPQVRSSSLRNRGQIKAVRLISFDSLMSYLRGLEEAQAAVYPVTGADENQFAVGGQAGGVQQYYANNPPQTTIAGLNVQACEAPFRALETRSVTPSAGFASRTL